MAGIRETKKQQTRKAIMQAAITLFSEKGFEKTSIEELAKAAGIGKGTIYGYFQTKSDILHAFCEDELESLHAELTSNADREIPHPAADGQHLYERIQPFTQNREFARLFMQQTAFPRDVDRKSIWPTKTTISNCSFLCSKRPRNGGSCAGISIFSISPDISTVCICSWSPPGSAAGCRPKRPKRPLQPSFARPWKGCSPDRPTIHDKEDTMNRPDYHPADRQGQNRLFPLEQPAATGSCSPCIALVFVLAGAIKNKSA